MTSVYKKANEIIQNAYEVAVSAESSSGREGARLEVSLFVRAEEDGVWTPFAIEMLNSFLTDIGRILVSADYIAAEKYAQQNPWLNVFDVHDVVSRYWWTTELGSCGR